MPGPVETTVGRVLAQAEKSALVEEEGKPLMGGEKYGPTESGLTAALIALGSTPDAVATTLANGGYRGERVNCGVCPVANYLKDVTGREAEVRPDECGLVVGETRAGYLRWQWIETPPAVAEFVTAFDNGMWPELAVES